MDFFSLIFEIGMGASRKVSEEFETFHTNVLNLIVPGEDWHRIGHVRTCSVSHENYLRENAGLISRLQGERDAINKVRAVLLDFSSNPISVRDPIIFELIDQYLVPERHGIEFLIILQNSIPGKSSPISKHLLEYSDCDDKPKIWIVGTDGNAVEINSGIYTNHQLDRYKDLQDILYGPPSERLDKYCVKRLGHFQDYSIAPDRIARCRNYSYFFRGGDLEFYSLFSDWIDTHYIRGMFLMHDTKNNQVFKEAIEAVCVESGIEFDSATKVLSDTSYVFPTSDPQIILAVDVIHEGNRLSDIVSTLVGRGIRVSNDVIAAVSKSGGHQSSVTIGDDDFSVQAFVARSKDHAPSACVQCEIGLDSTDSHREQNSSLRTYDVIKFIRDSGWTSEPDDQLPFGQEKPYTIIPDFSDILREYGDWLAFKLYKNLTKENWSEEVFIVHPSEHHSQELAFKLTKTLDRRSQSIAIDRTSVINQLQEKPDQWDTILESLSGSQWYVDLEELSASGKHALLVDVFKVSGATARTLEELLRKQFGIEIAAHVCIIDYNPEEPISDSCPVYPLYKWNWPSRI